MTAAPPRRPDESMSRLREMQENPLDIGYAAAAEGKARPTRTLPRWRQGVVVLACAILALGSVWATRELRAPDLTELPARTLLVEEIQARTADGESLRRTNAELQQEIETLQEEALAGTGTAFLDYVRNLGIASGHTRVTGPGIVIELVDSPDARAGNAGSQDERVKDVDLQVLVNSLWASGAEAIAINSHRLSSTSAIRAAGETIFVNLDPVVSPYRVEVVGDPARLQTELARTPAATHLGVLRSAYDISVTTTTAEELRLPALPAGTPRFAEPLEKDEEGRDVALGPPDVTGSGAAVLARSGAGGMS